MPDPAARNASASSCMALIISAFTSFVRWICALMMDTMFSLGMSGMTVPSRVTMPRDTLVMDGGSVTLHWRVRLRMSESS